jgi:hypothetical protein
VQQRAVGFYSSERDEGRDGDFEAEHLYELLDGLRQNLICAEGHPVLPLVTYCSPISSSRTRTAQTRCRQSSATPRTNGARIPCCSGPRPAASRATTAVRKTWWHQFRRRSLCAVFKDVQSERMYGLVEEWRLVVDSGTPIRARVSSNLCRRLGFPLHPLAFPHRSSPVRALAGHGGCEKVSRTCL